MLEGGTAYLARVPVFRPVLLVEANLLIYLFFRVLAWFWQLEITAII
jgi:hypothetical protein